MVTSQIKEDILAVGRISAVPSILKVVAELTGMRVTMIARVTSDSWTACAAYDRMGFGLDVGTQLDVTTTLCKEVCDSNKAIVIEHASLDPIYQVHRTPKHYNIESYIAIPILRPDGQLFGTLCAIDSRPAKLDPKVIASLTLFTELISSQLGTEDERAKMELYAQELELKVKERTAKLQETVSELESFSYSISHDMRAPLRAMQSYARILADECGEQVNEQGKEYIRRIISSSDRMDRLIQDMLVFSRLAPTEISLERIDVRELLNGVLESYPQFDSAAADICVIGLIPPVKANGAALALCFSNLLDNAIKFSAPDTRPEMRIWAERTGSRVRIFVKDNGVGIAPNQWEKIFGIFYRIDQSTAGTGIGLSIVKKALERMGGGVGLISEVGKGSTFYLELLAAES